MCVVSLFDLELFSVVLGVDVLQSYGSEWEERAGHLLLLLWIIKSVQQGSSSL